MTRWKWAVNIDHLCIVPGKAKAPEAKDKGDKGKAIEATVSVGDRLRMVLSRSDKALTKHWQHVTLW